MYDWEPTVSLCGMPQAPPLAKATAPNLRCTPRGPAPLPKRLLLLRLLCLRLGVRATAFSGREPLRLRIQEVVLHRGNGVRNDCIHDHTYRVVSFIEPRTPHNPLPTTPRDRCAHELSVRLCRPGTCLEQPGECHCHRWLFINPSHGRYNSDDVAVSSETNHRPSA